jgi:glycosyltransferase A (GT-A) superfamily protein (DUF2064 family)
MMAIALPGFLTGSLWKVATAGIGIVSLVLVSLLMSSYFENRDLLSQRTALMQTINDPVTGYVAKLAQARTNVATLTKSLDHQKKSFQALEATSNTKLKASEAQLAAAQAKTKSMEVRLNSFLATKPQGATPGARIRDIDERGLKEMVK